MLWGKLWQTSSFSAICIVWRYSISSRWSARLSSNNHRLKMLILLRLRDSFCKSMIYWRSMSPGNSFCPVDCRLMLPKESWSCFILLWSSRWIRQNCCALLDSLDRRKCSKMCTMAFVLVVSKRKSAPSDVRYAGKDWELKSAQNVVHTVTVTRHLVALLRLSYLVNSPEPELISENLEPNHFMLS